MPDPLGPQLPPPRRPATGAQPRLPTGVHGKPPTGAYARPPTGAMPGPVRAQAGGHWPWLLIAAMVGIALSSAGVTWLLVRGGHDSPHHHPDHVAVTPAVAIAAGPAHHPTLPHRPPLAPEQLGQPLDSTWQAALSARYAALPPLASPVLAQVGRADWQGEPTQLAGDKPIRPHGIVRYPKTPGRHPLALLIHGNHGTCRGDQGPDTCPADPLAACPTGQHPVDTPGGLAWVADELAARGWIAEIVDVAPAVCMPGHDAIVARSDQTIAHLRAWQAWQRGAHPLIPPEVAASADLQQVALIGHSTGGDAALLAGAKLVHPAAIGLETVRLQSLLLIAPPDWSHGPIPGVELGIVLPTCDFDVYPLQGRHILDRAAAAQPGSRVAMWLLGGGSHNAFNQSWRDETVDIDQQNCDPAYRLAPETQRSVLGRLAVDWLEAARTGTALPPWLNGQGQLPVASPVDLRTVVLPAGRRVPAGQTVVASDGAQLTDCQKARCETGIQRTAATWVARNAREGTVLAWHWQPADTEPASHAIVRIAALDGAPRHGPTLLDAAWLDEHGQATPAGSVEVGPPLDQAAEIDGHGSRPWPLAAVTVPLPAAAADHLAGLRLAVRGAGPTALAVGEVTLANF